MAYIKSILAGGFILILIAIAFLMLAFKFMHTIVDSNKPILNEIIEVNSIPDGATKFTNKDGKCRYKIRNEDGTYTTSDCFSVPD